MHEDLIADAREAADQLDDECDGDIADLLRTMADALIDSQPPLPLGGHVARLAGHGFFPAETDYTTLYIRPDDMKGVLVHASPGPAGRTIRVFRPVCPPGVGDAEQVEEGVRACDMKDEGPSLGDLVAQYSGTVKRLGPDSIEAKQLRAAQEGNRTFLEYADAIDGIKRELAAPNAPPSDLRCSESRPPEAQPSLGGKDLRASGGQAPARNRLFIWSSNILCDYSDGLVVVLAPDEDTARSMAVDCIGVDADECGLDKPPDEIVDVDGPGHVAWVYGGQ